jgi:hypothetical protein
MNRFRNYILMAAGFAVLVMVVGVFSAGPAIAQAVRAALVLNVDDPGRIPYEFSGGGCQFVGSACSITLPTVLAGKRLVITHVSGYVPTNLPAGTLVQVFVFDEVSGHGAFHPVTFSGSRLGQNYFVFDQQELIFVDAGKQPFVGFALGDLPPGTGFEPFVNVSGYLLDCNAGPCAAIVP